DIRNAIAEGRKMFPQSIWNRPIWCLYDDTSGRVVLKHPWRKGMSVPCPHCGKPLAVETNKAACCSQEFRTSFGEIRQREPAGSRTPDFRPRLGVSGHARHRPVRPG